MNISLAKGPFEFTLTGSQVKLPVDSGSAEFMDHRALISLLARFGGGQGFDVFNVSYTFLRLDIVEVVKLDDISAALWAKRERKEPDPLKAITKILDFSAQKKRSSGQGGAHGRRGRRRVGDNVLAANDFEVAHEILLIC
jgi:hypothetical protein